MVVRSIVFPSIGRLNEEGVVDILSDQIYSQAQNCLLEKVDNDVLLYNPENTMTLHLNDSSSLIWQMLDGKIRVSELIALLQQQFPESQAQIEQDVMEVLVKMLESGVIVAELG